MSKSGSNKPAFSRSISAKPVKHNFELDSDDELFEIPVSMCANNRNSLVASARSSSNSSTKIKYRKSSTSRATSTGICSNESSRLYPQTNKTNEFSEKLKLISEQKLYLLPHETPNCFVVYGDSSSKYKVNIGPQTCSCIATKNASLFNQTFPCVHLLFIMCKVLQVSEKDPILFAERLKSFEAENLLHNFNKRKRDKVKIPFKSNDKTSTESNSDISKVNLNINKSNDSKSSSPSYMKNLNSKRDPNVIFDEIICSICLSEMNVKHQLDICSNCSNEFHTKCISIWIKECRKQDEAVTCPLCRNKWRKDISQIPQNLSYLPRSQSTFVANTSSSQASVNNNRLTTSVFNNATTSTNTNDTSTVTNNNGNFNNIVGNTTELPTCNLYLNMASRTNNNKNNNTVTANNKSEANPSHKPIGFCFSNEVSSKLISEVSEQREAALRQVAEKTVHIVLSAGTAYSTLTTTGDSIKHMTTTGTNSNITTIRTSNINMASSDDCVVGCVGGHTTGVVLKEAFRVIAKLLDDPCYNLFVAALRAFREILGYLVCRTEPEIDRMSRMISPVICQLLRICGDFSQKKKSQMSLSALFELAKGQEGGISLGSELKKPSLAVTGCDRLAKFVLGISNNSLHNGQYHFSSHSRFRSAHSYGRLALLERLLDKFELDLELLKLVLDLVANQLQLMYRAYQLIGSSSSNNTTNKGCLEELTETTDVDTGLSTSDLKILANPRLHKLGKVLFINVAKVTMTKFKYSGYSSDNVYTEINKHVYRIPDEWRDKFITKLKLPLQIYGTTFSTTENNNLTCFTINNNNNNNVNNNPNTSSTNISINVSCGNFSKSYRMSKRFNQQNKSSVNNSTGNLLSKSRTRSVGSSSFCIGQNTSTVNNVGTGNCVGGNYPSNISTSNASINRISPFIRITPEPAYDAVALSDDEAIVDEDDEIEDEIDIDELVSDEKNPSKTKERRRRSNAAFFSELAIHNSMYGSMTDTTSISNNNNNQNDSSNDLSNDDSSSCCSYQLKEKEKQCDIVSVKMLKAVLKEQQMELDDKTNSYETRSPPGLGLFLSTYRQGYEWIRGQLLGTGAFSKCYQARDTRTGFLMAVKCQQCPPDATNILSGLLTTINNNTGATTTNTTINTLTNSSNQDTSTVARAVRTEVQLMSRLRHPNVLPLLGASYCPLSTTVSVFVEWMPGGSVASLLHQYGAFREPVTLAYSLQAARGLTYIHDKSILHRDLKGANLLLDTSGMRLRISDFGASARLKNGRDSNATDFRGQLLGTIAFMAPEVLRGEQYGRSCDVWSFGCCIIEMLTGSQPWRDRNHTNHLALVYTIASAEEPPKLPEKISEELQELLKTCFSKQPKQRPLSNQLEHFKVYQNFLK